MKQIYLYSRLLSLTFLLIISPTLWAQLTYNFDAETGVLTIAGAGSTVTAEEVNRAIGRVESADNLLKRVEFDTTTGITVIGDNAFARCLNLEQVNLPDGVTTLGEKAFYFCRNLRIINLPSSVTTIGETAFGLCSTLGSIVCLSPTPPTISINTFSNYAMFCVTSEALAAYQENELWSKYLIVDLESTELSYSIDEETGGRSYRRRGLCHCGA